MRKPIEVAAAVIEQDRKFLITLRLETSPMGHCWEFPGGKIEPGETVEACIVRECREEIGVTVEPLRRIQEMTYDYPHGFIHLWFVHCRIVVGAPTPIECREVRWIERHEFPNYEFPPADVGVIDLLVGKN